MPKYNITVFWSEVDGLWIADAPDLRYCSAHGDTPEDAVRELKVAMDLWLECARDYGDPLPEPRYRPPLLEQLYPVAA